MNITQIDWEDVVNNTNLYKKHIKQFDIKEDIHYNISKMGETRNLYRDYFKHSKNLLNKALYSQFANNYHGDNKYLQNGDWFFDIVFSKYLCDSYVEILEYKLGKIEEMNTDFYNSLLDIHRFEDKSEEINILSL